jgi:hypothetical protein
MKVRYFTVTHLPHNQNSSIYVVSLTNVFITILVRYQSVVSVTFRDKVNTYSIQLFHLYYNFSIF